MTPLQVFEDTFRVAELLVNVYRLLENDGLKTEGELVNSLRSALSCRDDEQLQLIVNTAFVGCIRESANLPPSQLKIQSLQNLLRQAVVSACTAYEAYLSAILGEHLLTAIEVRRRDTFPADQEVVRYFEGLSLGMDEAFRLLDQEDRTVVLHAKIMNYVRKKNLGSVAGLKTVGLLLGIPDPWNAVAAHLGRERKDLTRTITAAIDRRNDIVHKADRDLNSPTLEKQPITLSWTHLAVDTIKIVCLAFDEIVTAHMKAWSAELAARRQEAAHA